jgi:D-amino-acid oxidase
MGDLLSAISATMNTEDFMDASQLDRRSVLKFGALALAGTAVPLAGHTQVITAQQDLKTLPRVNLAPDRVTRKIAGLRPFRPSGFVVKAEPMGDKTVIHNYGHGGCGVTLSWGTADMAVTLALETPHREAAVIGCGAVGLATARLLQDRGFQVTIYAAALPPNTTSNVAAAMFGVTSLVDEAHHTDDAIVKQIQYAARFAHRYFQNFVGERYGVHWNEMFLLGDEPPEQPWDFAITPELYPLTVYQPGEHPFPFKYAARFYTMMIETNNYLPQVLADFFLRGGQLQLQTFADQAALSKLQEPLILNCTGLGAKELFGDKELVPVKGQLTCLLPQPEVKYAYLDGRRDLYMFPRSDTIILGGSHEEGVSSTEPDEKLAERIYKGHKQIVSEMK